VADIRWWRLMTATYWVLQHHYPCQASGAKLLNYRIFFGCRDAGYELAKSLQPGEAWSITGKEIGETA
jgi:hypothetical protein